MISSTQALLARTLLKLSQKEVAAKIGIAHSTLSNIENGESDPPASRLQQLQTFYEDQGIEFIDSDGIRRRQMNVRHYDGVEGFRAFMDDVYETVKQYGGEMCLFNTQPSLWTKHLGKDWYAMHNKRMTELGDRIKVRIAIREGDQSFILDCAEYKWLPKDKWKDRMYYTYGPKLAFLHFEDSNIHIIVFNEGELADSFRVLYDIAWEHAAISPQ